MPSPENANPTTPLLDPTLEANLKSTLWYQIGQLVDDETVTLGINATPQYIGSLSELVWTQLRDIRLEKIPVPTTGAGKVKIAPKFCGICGSDLHEYLGGANLIPKPGSPHPITGESLPLTLGHEFSGIVEEVGLGVSNFKVGDRVCVQPIIYDGDCRSCKRGLVNCCDKNGFVGLSGWHGGLCDHMVVPESCVKKLPDNISLEVGALIEPLAVGWHAVKISPYKDGDSVLVLGSGPIGLAVIQALVSKGCKNIIVSEVSGKRREFAKQFGAHHLIDPTRSDVVEAVERLTGGAGADVAFDAAGVQPAVDTAFKALKARGTLMNIAVWHQRAQLQMNDIVFRERAYMGVATYSLGVFEDVIDDISNGRVKPEGMITKVITLDQVVDQGFDTLINDKESHVKILVDVAMGYGGLALRFSATGLRLIEFGAATIVLGIYSYYLAVLTQKKLQIPTWEKAVEGIGGAAVLYTIFGVLLTFFLGGVRVFGAIAILLDILFAGAFIVVAWYTRHGANSCQGVVNTPLGSAPSNSSAPGAGSYGFVCRLNTAVFAVSVLNIFLFIITALWQALLIHNHKKEKRYGPGPSNNYTSGSRPAFWRRKKDTTDTRDAELATAGAGARVSHETGTTLNGGTAHVTAGGKTEQGYATNY
ncbi:hypothetical protein DV738_g4957, partial [Chaetothyriales sp. CBS 135597]